MGHHEFKPIPHKDPISGKRLVVTELTTEDGDVTIRSKFELPRVSMLEPEQYRFLETFLRCRGVISAVEKELGISYPTVKSRLEQLINAMNLSPVERQDKPISGAKLKILEQLERGEISAEEAKAAMRGTR